MLPNDQPAQNIPCPRTTAAALAPDRQWVSDQLSLIQAEIRLLAISGALTLCGISTTLVIILLQSP